MSFSVIGRKIIRLGSVKSTNDYAKQLLLTGNRSVDGTVIIAHEQISGRGQFVNLWESEPGANLTFSIILSNSKVSIETSYFLSVFISLAIVDTLENYGEGFLIKWPNDIYYKNHQKIAGILIENSLVGSEILNSIIGVGLNINQTVFISGAPNPVSLKGLFRKNFDLNEILANILEFCSKRYEQLIKEDYKNLIADYYKRLYLFGEWHAFNTPSSVIEGRIVGIEEDGKLIIEERDTGKKRSFMFKEVEFPKLFV